MGLGFVGHLGPSYRLVCIPPGRHRSGAGWLSLDCFQFRVALNHEFVQPLQQVHFHPQLPNHTAGPEFQCVDSSGDRRFADHRPGFGSTARQGDIFPRIFRDFPGCLGIFRYFSGFFGILRYISLVFGILRDFSARAAPVAGTQGPEHRPASESTARPGGAI